MINEEGRFALEEYKLENDEVFQIQNNSDENQTVKKENDDSTVAEVNANSTSRELTLDDNSRTELYLAGDEEQKTTIAVGSPSDEPNPDAPEAADQPEANGEVADTNTELPDTGPANNLVYVVIATIGFGLYKVSKKLLN